MVSVSPCVRESIATSLTAGRRYTAHGCAISRHTCVTPLGYRCGRSVAVTSVGASPPLRQHSALWILSTHRRIIPMAEVTIQPVPTAFFIPPLVEGDREFAGHGPVTSL